MGDFRSFIRVLGRSSRRAVITLVGGAVLLTGIVGLFFPILPGWLLIIAGLAILATEYVWARRALGKAREQARRAADKVRARRKKRRENR
jgi:uncharacterized protein (TIGR02611 family)